MASNPNFFSNFSEDKMTESVKLADYRSSSHEGHQHAFEKYVDQANKENSLFNGDKFSKIINHDTVDLGGNARQIKTEYSQVSHVETGFQKNKSNQAQMLKELRSQYDNLKKLQMPTREVKTPSSNSDSRHQVSEEASSIPPSKLRKKDSMEREERFWNMERKQYQNIIQNCQRKIQELIHSEMTYKRMIHELRSEATPSVKKVQSKPDHSQIRELQSGLRQEQQKNRILQKQLERLKSLSRQQLDAKSRAEGQLSKRSRQFQTNDEEKKKLDSQVRVYRQKCMSLQIDKRKAQLQVEMIEKQKALQINSLIKQTENLKANLETNERNFKKRMEEEIQLKDKRYKLLLQQFQKLKREAVQKKQDPEPNHLLSTFKEIRSLIQSNRNSQNEQLNKAISLMTKKMQNAAQQSSIIDEYERKNKKLETQIKIVKVQLESLGERLRLKTKQSAQKQKIKTVYEKEMITLQDTINLLQKKIKEKAMITQQSTPRTTKNSQEDISAYKRKIDDLEFELRDKQTSSGENQKLYQTFKQKWEANEEEIRNLKRALDETSFQLEKAHKELESRTIMLQNEHAISSRMMKGDIERANQNAVYWRQEFENIRRFYEAKIQQKNRIIEESFANVDLTIIKKEYQQNLERAKSQYERQISNLVQRLEEHPSTSVEYEDLLNKYTQLEVDYFDLSKNSHKTRYLNDNLDHLWSIKEVEYGNVNAIIEQVKKSPMRPHQNSQIYYTTKNGNYASDALAGDNSHVLIKKSSANSQSRENYESRVVFMKKATSGPYSDPKLQNQSSGGSYQMRTELIQA